MGKVSKGVFGFAMVAGLVSAGLAHREAVKEIEKLAFARNYPKTNFARMRGRATVSENARAFDIYLTCQGHRLRSKALEAIQIPSSDGILLTGHWYPAENAKRVIIAMHGWRSSWYHDFGMVSNFLKEEGCSVLYAQQRGQNNAQGDGIGFGVLERYDCLSWVKWAQSNTPENLPIYLLGISMGATTVMLASELELGNRVKGIIADCGFTSVEAIGSHVLKSLNVHLPFSKRTMDYLCKKHLQVKANAVSTVQALKNSRLPFFLAHGEADTFVPAAMSRENFQSAEGRGELFTVKDAEHGMCYYCAPREYERRVKAFWEKYDN